MEIKTYELDMQIGLEHQRALGIPSSLTTHDTIEELQNYAEVILKSVHDVIGNKPLMINYTIKAVIKHNWAFIEPKSK